MTKIFGLSLVVSLFNNYYTNTIIKLQFSRLFNLLLIYSSLLSILYYSTHDITYSTCYYSSIVINLFIMVVHIICAIINLLYHLCYCAVVLAFYIIHFTATCTTYTF